ncbi:hypothetical protein DU490_13860 [Halomonas sp. DQ26W]|nr:hypothetical protein DU490_13860 [Halomonas sp. DQ26W]
MVKQATPMNPLAQRGGDRRTPRQPIDALSRRTTDGAAQVPYRYFQLDSVDQQWRFPDPPAVDVMHQETGMVTAATDRWEPVIGRQLEPQCLRVQKLVVSGGETSPERAERGCQCRRPRLRRGLRQGA